jgi:hypothetical protein
MTFLTSGYLSKGVESSSAAKADSVTLCEGMSMRRLVHQRELQLNVEAKAVPLHALKALGGDTRYSRKIFKHLIGDRTQKPLHLKIYPETIRLPEYFNVR